MPKINQNYIKECEIKSDDPVEVIFHRGKPLLAYYSGIRERFLIVYNVSDYLTNLPEEQRIPSDIIKDVIKLSRSK